MNIRHILSAALLSTLLAVPAAASCLLSPGLGILAGQHDMIASGTAAG